MAKIKMKKIFGAVLVGALVILGIIFFWWQVEDAWNTSDSWAPKTIKGLSFIEEPEKFHNLKLSVKELSDKGETRYEVNFEYALLYDVKEIDKELHYYFLLLPYRYVRYKAHNWDELRKLEPHFEIVVPSEKKPSEFLGRKILSKYTYSTLPIYRLRQGDPLPVSLRLVFKRASGEGSLYSKVRHWYWYTVKHQPEFYKEEVEDWSVTSVPIAEEYFKANDPNKYLSEWQTKVWDFYKSNLLAGTLENWGYDLEKASVNLIRIFSARGGRNVLEGCNLEGCKKEKRSANPATLFSYLTYLAYHSDKDAYNKLVTAFNYTFGKQEKLDELCGKNELNWCNFWPSFFSIYPINKEKELVELFDKKWSSYVTSATPFLDVGDKDFLRPRYWNSEIFLAYPKIEKLAIKNGCSVALGSVKKPGVKEALKNILEMRSICENCQNCAAKESSALSYPLDTERVAKIIYDSVVLSPYKDIRVFELTDLSGNLDDVYFLNAKDNLLTLIWAYEAYGESRR